MESGIYIYAKNSHRATKRQTGNEILKLQYSYIVIELKSIIELK
jgi:hypothetical protein